ncbi:hypothetical protein XELAEV_18038386mg [Xenopus laevis]|uniref:Immunoglobulin domain-containing protein n=1 Tax=Xenopus laevis TaxID=8355 RepID=A0A974C5L3_XENLA|nr:hypothetical protein XELAEV_18038386mg [Xenopus laevis]
MTDSRVFFFVPIFNILFTDSIVGDDLTVHEDSLNVTVGQSVLLPTSYSITSPITNWPSIEWVIRGHTIVYCSVSDGSLSAEGSPVRITGDTRISPKYQGRVDFFKLNASLLLKDLTEADTGKYTVRLLMDDNIYKGTIHLWVQQSPLSVDSMVGNNLTVHKRSLNVTAGQSVLLPTTYSISTPPQHWPSIEWVLGGQTIVHCSVRNGSVSSEGLPMWVTEKTRISSEYRGRVELFPLNASLLLKDLSVDDSGTYTVRLLMAKKVIEGTVHVWVQRSPASFGNDLIVHKGFLNVTVDQSVLLPTTYSVYSPPRQWPSIEWMIGGQTIAHCSVYNGSLSAEGHPLWVTEITIISPEYQGRVEFFPLNASLILKHLSVNDTGTYMVRLLMPGDIMEGTIYLWVESTPASFVTEVKVKQKFTTERDDTQYNTNKSKAAELDSIVGDEMIVYEDNINVTAGQSVLLQTTYFIPSPRRYWPSIEWVIGGHTIVYCSLLNGTIGAKGRPTWVEEKTKIFTKYEGRVEFFPLNGSLLLKDPSVNDSGTYTVKLLMIGSTITRTIHVWVQGSPTAVEEAVTQHKRLVIFILRTIGCFLVVVVLCILILCCECR